MANLAYQLRSAAVHAEEREETLEDGRVYNEFLTWVERVQLYRMGLYLDRHDYPRKTKAQRAKIVAAKILSIHFAATILEDK